MLKFLKQLFARITDFFVLAEQRQREAYLADSADIFDLERRIRAIEHGSRPFVV